MPSLFAFADPGRTRSASTSGRARAVTTGRSLLITGRPDAKRSLRDPQENTTAYTKDNMRPLGVACLALEAIESLPLRGGLMFRVNSAAEN